MSIGKILDSIDMRFSNSSTVRESTARFDKNSSDAHEREPGAEETLSVVDKLNSSVEELNGRLSFHYHEKTHRVIMKVIDPQTEEVIREIPARDAIKLLEHIQDYLGMLVDESR